MITVNKSDLGELLLMEELSMLNATQSRIAYFEKKYGMSFDEFKIQIEEKEVFSEYDDLIEWKAFLDKKLSIEHKIAAIRNGHFQVS